MCDKGEFSEVSYSQSEIKLFQPNFHKVILL